MGVSVQSLLHSEDHAALGALRRLAFLVHAPDMIVEVAFALEGEAALAAAVGSVDVNAADVSSEAIFALERQRTNFAFEGPGSSLLRRVLGTNERFSTVCAVEGLFNHCRPWRRSDFNAILGLIGDRDLIATLASIVIEKAQAFVLDFVDGRLFQQILSHRHHHELGKLKGPPKQDRFYDGFRVLVGDSGLRLADWCDGQLRVVEQSSWDR